MDGKEQSMDHTVPLSIQFIPIGPHRVRLVCRISTHYTLYAEYVHGRLQDLKLVRG